VTEQAERSAIDVLIVTAIKEEYDEALKVNEGAIDESWEKKPGPVGLEVAFRNYRASSGAPIKVALTRALEMRGVAAAAAASPLIFQYQPRCLAMCGVCAGRRGAVNLGDVIIGDILYTYDTGSSVVEYEQDDRRQERFRGEPSPYQIIANWKQLAESFQESMGKASWIAERPIGLEYQENWLLQQIYIGVDPLKNTNRMNSCPAWSKVIERLWKNGYLVESALILTDKGRARVKRDQILHPDALPKPPDFHWQ
jgi:hypothetical protein